MIAVRLDAYNGPLDLLLKLITKNEIDIYDIPISLLTDQYMNELEQLERYDMDAMSEFLVMAATLLEIKSKMLIIKNEPIESDEDPRQELAERLLEYQRIKEITEHFRELEEIGSKFHYRDPSDIKLKYEKGSVNMDALLHNVDLNRLRELLNDVLRRSESKTDKIRSGFGTIHKDAFTIEEKIEHIQSLLLSKRSNQAPFRALFTEDTSRTEIIVTFLALLEMMKLGLVLIHQKNLFAEIYIILNKITGTGAYERVK